MHRTGRWLTEDCIELRRGPFLHSRQNVLVHVLGQEYAVCYLSCNPDTLVEAVSKGSVDLPADLTKALGLDDTLLVRSNEPRPSGSADRVVPFTPLSEVKKAVTAAITAIDFEGMAKRAAEAAWDPAQGRV